MSNTIMTPIGDDRVEITPGATGWQTISLSGYGVPVGSSGAIIEFDVSGSFRHVGVRHPDQSGSYNGYLYTNAHCWFIAPCNDAAQIEVYYAGGSDHIYLHGYTGADVTMLTARVDKTPGSSYVWTATDCSAQAPGATALIFEVFSSYPYAATIGFRKNGSSDTITSSMRYHSFFIVGCDASQICELYAQLGSPNTKIYLTGYITGTVGFQAFTNWTQKTGIGSENTVDVSALAPNGEMVMVYFRNANAYYSIRKDSGYSNNYSNGTGPMVAIMGLTDAQTFLARSADGYCYIVGYAGAPLDSEDLIPNAAGDETNILYSTPATHWQACLSRDATFDPGVGTWGAFSGNLVSDDSNLTSHRDLYNLTNPSQRLEGIVKIKWKARPGRSIYPYGNYWRAIKTGGTVYEGSEHGCPVWSTQPGDKCEVIRLNPKTGVAWTLDDLDALQAGIRIGEAASYGTTVCDYVKVTVCWIDAEVTTDGFTLWTGTTARLHGTVEEDEGMDADDITVYFQWGETTSYGNTTTPQTGFGKGESFYDDISGLDPDKRYHFRAVLVTDCGETFYGDDNVLPNRIYVWIGDETTPEQYELTKPSYPMVLSARTERGRDEELGYAAAGIAEITCDNFYGDFSPENTGGTYYGVLQLGAVLTVYEVYEGITYRHFYGKIDKIEPHPEPDNLTAYILAVDGTDDLAGSEVETVLRTDTDESQMVEDALDGAGWSATKKDLDAGVDTLQLGWWHQTFALDGIRKMEDSTRGFFLVDIDGYALWQNRHYRVTGARLVSQYDFGEYLTEIGYQWSKRDVKNWARISGSKYIDPFYGLPDEEWIWYATANDEAAPFIPANSSITVWAPLKGPRKSSDTLVKGTHWNANSQYDKSGDDLSDSITVTPTYYGQAIKFVIANAGDVDAYMVIPDSPPSGAPENATLLVYGTIYEEIVMAVVEEDSTSQQQHGKRTVSIDARFKSNYNDLLAYAQWLIARFKDPLPTPVLATVNAWTNYPDDEIKIQCLARKISDRVTAASTNLGIDQDYYIDKIIQDYALNEGGTVHNTTYSLSRTEGQAEGLFWILGVVGFSELGITTRLGL